MKEIRPSWKDLEEDLHAMIAGRISQTQFNERSRITHTPRMLGILAELRGARFALGDARGAIVAECARVVELTLDMLSIISQIGNGTPSNADLVRLEAMKAEMVQINSRMTRYVERVRSDQSKR